MNACFYLAIDRLPLGTVAAIEFLPVILLAAFGARTPRNAAALALAVRGVYLLTDVQLVASPSGSPSPPPTPSCSRCTSSSPTGWRSTTHRRHRRPRRLDAVAAVVVTPIGGWEVLPAIGDPVAILAGIGVGVSSSVIPYVSDQLAMRRLARAT
jgi:inner membrane transporter RhtA